MSLMLRILYSLTFIINVCMGSHLFIAYIQPFKNNDSRVSQGRAVKDKFHFHSSIGFFGCKNFFRCYLFLLIQHWFPCPLVHEDALYCIFLTWNQILISHRICKRRLFLPDTLLTSRSFILGLGTQSRIMDALVLIIDICMSSHFHTVVQDIFKNNYCLPCKECGIQLIYQFNAALCLLSCKSLLRCNLPLPTVLYRFSCLLIHEGSSYCVLFAGKQTCIGHNIYYRCFLTDSSGMPSCSTMSGVVKVNPDSDVDIPRYPTEPELDSTASLT